MQLTTETFGDVIVVHSPEELAGDHALELLETVRGMTPVRVVLDLDGAETIDSVGLTALLDLQDALRELAGDLKISSANPSNRKILEVTRLDHTLEVFDSVIDAVKSYR